MRSTNNTLVNIIVILCKVILFCVVVLYFALLGYIPLAEFMVQPTLQLGVWLGSVAVLLGLGGWLVCCFSTKLLMVWIVLALVVHGIIWVLPDIIMAFEEDACLDKGLIIQEDVCIF